MNGIYLNGTGGALTDIFIRNCNARGTWAYGTAIDVAGATITTSVQITNCAGYNDQGVLLGGIIVGGSTNVTNFFRGYWGPMEVYIAPQPGTMITNIFVDGHNTHLLTGSFFLNPAEGLNVTWTPTTSSINITVIGK